MKSRWLDQAMIWICLIPLCIKPWHSDTCFFSYYYYYYFLLRRRRGWKRIACPLVTWIQGQHSVYARNAMERGADDRGRPSKYVKTLAKTQEAPDRCLSRKRQEEEVMMRMYTRTAQDAICYHILVTAWDLQPTRKEQYIRPAALSVVKRVRYVCT